MTLIAHDEPFFIITVCLRKNIFLGAHDSKFERAFKYAKSSKACQKDKFDLNRRRKQLKEVKTYPCCTILSMFRQFLESTSQPFDVRFDYIGYYFLHYHYRHTLSSLTSILILILMLAILIKSSTHIGWSLPFSNRWVGYTVFNFVHHINYSEKHQCAEFKFDWDIMSNHILVMHIHCQNT